MVIGVLDVQRGSAMIHELVGQASISCTLSIVSGPLLMTATVNLTSSPGENVVLFAILVIVAFASGA
jgi:hypothetical protein